VHRIYESGVVNKVQRTPARGGRNVHRTRGAKLMTDLKWWQTAVFYQIYPRSCADGNGDGIGDLQGIIDKLDYLADLGVDALWLSPHYPSPQADCGYDVSDYTDVAPEYGTLDEFRVFLDEAHKRGIRVILDLVLNHSSDQHPWFLESRSSRDSSKRDWYVWRDGTRGPNGERLPPNNWESTFTGSAWEYDPATEQYYYHYFLKEQPDLNWRNPEVVAAIWDAVRFWLDLGVDGYRLDAVGTIFEDPALPDQTSGMTLPELYLAWQAAQTDEERVALAVKSKAFSAHQVGQPGLHPLMVELRTVIDEYEDRMLVGESDDVAYYGTGDDELHLVFNFPLMRTGARRGAHATLTPAHIRANQEERLSALPAGAWPCNTLNNHDSTRVKSAFGDGEHDDELARLSLALLLTLRGTPFLYNGEEIGMVSATFDDLAQLRDTVALRVFEVGQAIGRPEEQATALACEMTRDRCRTPMQWADAPNAGFSPVGVETWLPVNPDYAEGVNVAEQMDDPDSMLSLYRRLLALRKRTPALIAGDYLPLLPDHEACFCFLRRTAEQTCLVALNYSDQAQTLALEGVQVSYLLFSSAGRRVAGDLAALELAPFEVYIAAS
jgi:alpha-glucosidase